jgi:hypothetical protein
MKLWMALYVSQASLDLTPAALTALVTRAQAKNALSGITGGLMYYRGRFMQVIEGDHDAVQQCLARIGNDTRHHDMTVVYNGPLATRRFGEWTMREIYAQRENEPVVDDFWRRLVDEHDDQALRTAVTLMQRLAQQDTAPR